MGDISKQLPGQLVAVADKLVSECDLAYLAGFFDGEGCVMVRKRGTRWESMLRFTNTSFPLMQHIATLTGASLSRRRPAKAGRKASFEVCLQHRRAEHWALAMRPFVRIKADEIDLLLEFRRTIIENRAERYRALAPELDARRVEIANVCAALKCRAYPIDARAQ